MAENADFVPNPLSRAELLALAEIQAEKGSVTAIKLLLDEMRREAENSPAGGEFDDLDGDTSNVRQIRPAS